MYKRFSILAAAFFTLFIRCSEKNPKTYSNIPFDKIASDTIPNNNAFSTILGKWTLEGSNGSLYISQDSILEVIGKHMDKYSYQLHDTATFDGKTVKLIGSYYLYLLQNNNVEFIYQILNLNDSILSLSKVQSNDIVIYRRLNK
ncbi:MAG: hypothetical protein HYZ15_06505 [Sphingobacteriales bacterium]|nr:hypothetical protein [Sphingobacteriales bacterium]